MEDFASDMQCATGTKSRISQTWDYHNPSNRVCFCSNDVNVLVKTVFVRGISTHQAIARTQSALKRTGQCMDEVKPCETWMYFAHEVKLVTCGILAKSVSSGCASALQAQHPHMVPLGFELPLHCVVLATTRAYLKSRI